MKPQKKPSGVQLALEEIELHVSSIEEALNELSRSIKQMLQINGQYTLPQAIEDVKYYRAKIRFLEEALMEAPKSVTAQSGNPVSGLGKGKSKSSVGSNQGKVSGVTRRYAAHPRKQGQ